MTLAHRALVLKAALDFFPVQVVISQRRVNFGRGQRGQSLANLLDGQSQFPPTRNSVDSNAMAFNARFPTQDASRLDDHGTQLTAIQTVGEGGAKARKRGWFFKGDSHRPDFLHFVHFDACNLYRVGYSRCRLSFKLASLRQQLWRAYTALAHTLRRLQRSHPMVQGSFYLLRRKCGKPNCRCVAGQLHATYVVTRSEQGKDRLYTVPKEQRTQVRQRTAEYRRYQRARAVLAKRQARLLALVDQMADQRLLVWPPKRAGTDV